MKKTFLARPMVLMGIFMWTLVLLGLKIQATNNSTSSLYSLKASNPANKNQLTAQNWDSLVSEVEKLKLEVGNSLQAGAGNSQQWNTTINVPAGAIMAFDLSSCPQGWTRYAKADNRFIMWASAWFGSIGGTGAIMMKANQLAPHSHWFVDSFFADGYDYANNWQAFGFREGVDKVSWNRWFGTDTNVDQDNYLRVVWRKTGSRIVKWDEKTQSHTPWDITAESKAYDWQSWIPDFGGYWTQQPLDILNPYIKLIYCKKN